METSLYDLRCHIFDNYIKNTHYEKWLDEMLKISNITILTNFTKKEIENYDKSLVNWGINSKSTRGMHYPNHRIYLHNNNETLDSLAWILLHELGHAWCEECKKKFGYDLFEALSGGSLDDMTKEEYKEYCEIDEIHEARYEEQFCNNIATKIIGRCYDRIWWRKQFLKEWNNE